MEFKVKGIHQGMLQSAQARLDQLVKPPGSLGGLEDMAARLCGIFGNLHPNIEKRCVVVLAADNGVVAEGVSSAPQETTALQTLNILEGVTGVGALAAAFGAQLLVADVGIKTDVPHPQLLDRKIRRSTGNIAVEPAMTRPEAECAIEVGRELARLAQAKDYTLLGVGEMGIGNTTTSSAVLAALLSLANPEAVIGRGAGLCDTAYTQKCKVIQKALALHQADPTDPIDVLQKLGGLDLCGMTGVFLGAAECGLPVVIDGFISVVAALCAKRLVPEAAAYFFASHRSFERGYSLAIAELELTPCLDLGMRLGEGSGCPLLFTVMDGALAMFQNMATFGESALGKDYTEMLGEIVF